MKRPTNHFSPGLVALLLPQNENQMNKMKITQNLAHAETKKTGAADVIVPLYSKQTLNVLYCADRRH